MKTFFATTLVCLSCALTACGPRAQLEACNIATETCQEDVYYALLRLRGDGYDPLAGVPPIRTLTVDQYEHELDPDGDEPEPEPDPMEPEPEPEEPKVVPWDVALQLLGLVMPTMSSGEAAVDNQVTHVAAFYASNTQMVTVIDRGGERDDRADTTLLLHELVHALQDRELSGDLDDGTTDGVLTARTQTEGEATLYEHLGSAEIEDLPARTLDWDTYYDNWLGGGREHLPEETSAFYGVRWFIYPLGAHYLTDAWLDAGNAGVRHAYAEPLHHMAQYMAGYGRASIARSSPLRCHIAPPSDDFKQKGLDRFGALELYSFLTAAGIRDRDGWPIAYGWIDDLIAVYFNEEDEKTVALTWRIRLEDEEAATKVVERATLKEGVRAERRGRDVIILGSNDEDAIDNWQGGFDCDDE